jgi:hypothetical protein
MVVSSNGAPQSGAPTVSNINDSPSRVIGRRYKTTDRVLRAALAVNQKTALCSDFQRVELSGLEPATSWMRSRSLCPVVTRVSTKCLHSPDVAWSREDAGGHEETTDAST